MKKPYIKKFSTISDFTVWLVDGKYIRENINEEFTNFGQHYEFKFIPEYELWIDKERISGEEKFYIDSMIAMKRFLEQGKSIHEAIRKSDEIERRERAKSALMKGEIKIRESKEEIIKKVHKKLLKKYSGKIKVWVVNGEFVRGSLFIEFTEGGHDLVYPFIPKGEVWIDDDVLPREIPFILIHELHERNLMAKGMKYIYGDTTADDAHKKASETEYYCRHHPEKLNEKLKREINNSK